LLSFVTAEKTEGNEETHLDIEHNIENNPDCGNELHYSFTPE
jgi:hypothetical protein